MKKIVIIAICVIGMVSLSSCRSTSKSCGLAENTKKNQQINIQQNVVVAEATVK